MKILKQFQGPMLEQLGIATPTCAGPRQSSSWTSAKKIQTPKNVEGRPGRPGGWGIGVVGIVATSRHLFASMVR